MFFIRLECHWRATFFLITSCACSVGYFQIFRLLSLFSIKISHSKNTVKRLWITYSIWVILKHWLADAWLRADSKYQKISSFETWNCIFIRFRQIQSGSKRKKNGISMSFCLEIVLLRSFGIYCFFFYNCSIPEYECNARMHQ